MWVFDRETRRFLEVNQAASVRAANLAVSCRPEPNATTGLAPLAAWSIAVNIR
jgi:hypothetical protein